MKRLFLFLAVTTVWAGCETSEDSTGNQSQPTIASMTPSQVYRGQTGDARITGTNFNGVQAVSLGDGIDMREIIGVTPTEIAIRFRVQNNAQPGARTVSITTTAGEATSASILSVGTNRLPVASFTVDPTTGVASTVFRFNGTSSHDQDGSIIRYQWEFGDGATAEGATPTHKFNTSGNFNVKLIVTDSDQATGFLAKGLSVKGGVLPVARFSVSPAKGDTSTRFTFNASTSDDPDGRIVDYRWDLGDGNRRTGKVIEYKYADSGRYMVELAVRDNHDLTHSTEKRIEVKGRAPVANFTISPQTGNINTTFRFDGSSSFAPDGRVTGYSWNFGDGRTASGAVVDHNFSVPQTYGIRLTIVDDDGKAASKQQNLRVFNADGGGGGDDDDDDDGGGGGGGRCTTPSRLHEPFFFRVIQEDRASKTIVGKFFKDVDCEDVFYKCGDVRIGGIGGQKEYWIGIICEMFDLGDNTFKIVLTEGKYWVEVGEQGTYVWPTPCEANTCR
jgi:PKD repeat protein